MNDEIIFMIERLFGSKKVTLEYMYSNSLFKVFVDGEELDEHLGDLYKRFDYVTRRENLTDRFNDYKSMNKLIEDEQLEVYIYPELYAWTRE